MVRILNRAPMQKRGFTRKINPPALERLLRLFVAILLLLLAVAFATASAVAQNVTSAATAQIEGTVRDVAGAPVAGVTLHLQGAGRSDAIDSKTNSDGTFAFSSVPSGIYSVKLRKAGFADAIEESILVAPAEKKHCDFVLRPAGEAPSPSDAAAGFQLDDRPTFTVAGVTDSTGSGGHGSETRMRTGEALAKETLHLESSSVKASGTGTSVRPSDSENALRDAVAKSPQSFEANHRLGEFYLRTDRWREAIPLLEAADQVNPEDFTNAFDLASALKSCGEFARSHDRIGQMLAKDKQLTAPQTADLHRLLGEIDEKLEDPLGAEREYEHAAGMDASEQNYFAWGSELLLHRAAAPAIEVFGKGTRLHPDSSRMLAGLGAALYTSGSAEDAAHRLCDASDLDPAAAAPYVFLGKMQESTSATLPCAEQKLARFAHDQPENALANYYYGLALWRRDRGSTDAETLQHAEALLKKATALDPKLDAAFLELGNLNFTRSAFPEAVASYEKAIAAHPASSQAHYRLGLAYKRLGDDAKAQSEFAQYKKLDQTEAANVERQRREIRQFLFVLKDQPAASRPAPDAAPPSPN